MQEITEAEKEDFYEKVDEIFNKYGANKTKDNKIRYLHKGKKFTPNINYWHFFVHVEKDNKLIESISCSNQYNVWSRLDLMLKKLENKEK